MALTRLFLVLRFCYEEAYILVHLKSDCKTSIYFDRLRDVKYANHLNSEAMDGVAALALEICTYDALHRHDACPFSRQV
jgi:hypothetical protein